MESHLAFEANIWNLSLKLLAIILRQLDIVLSYLAFKLLIVCRLRIVKPI
jgi:hypothetical protein